MRNAVVVIIALIIICLTAIAITYLVLLNAPLIQDHNEIARTEKPIADNSNPAPLPVNSENQNKASYGRKIIMIDEPVQIFNNNGYGAMTSYTDFDLSRFVAPQTKGVFLMVKTVNNSGYIICNIRKKGANLPSLKVISPVPSIENWGSGFVACDENQNIQYQVDGFLSGVGAITIWLIGCVE